MFSMNMLLLALAIAVTVSSVALLAFKPKRRHVILDRIGRYTRGVQSSSTAPRSSSPEKRGVAPPNSQTQQSREDMFPPHRRETLAQLAPGSLNGPGKSAKELSEEPPDYTRLTPDNAVCNTDEFLHHTTATGFTVEEIRRLGDFPDYPTLSGVPLPNEYKEFDIRTAMPRPYRPYRWPYHQTMCMLKKLLEFTEVLIARSTFETGH